MVAGGRAVGAAGAHRVPAGVLVGAPGDRVAGVLRRRRRCVVHRGHPDSAPRWRCWSISRATSRRILKAWFNGLFVAAHRTADYWLGWWVIIGTIPIGVVGLLFKDEIRTGARNLWIIATALIVFSRGHRRRRVLRQADPPASSSSPGRTASSSASRSASRWCRASRARARRSAPGLFLGQDRELAARFGFLLAIPAVFASGLFSLPDAFHPVGEGMSATGAAAVGGAPSSRSWSATPPSPGSCGSWCATACTGSSATASSLGVVVLILLGTGVMAAATMTVILLRHGRSTSNTAHTLAGRSRGRRPRRQGPRAGRGAGRPDRRHCRSGRSCARRCCAASARCEPLAAALGLEPVVDERISEVDYGAWTGRKIGDLVKEPLWAVVQQQPSAAVFPDGEGLAAGAGARGRGGARTRPPAGRASTAATCCGWPARTATSSRRCVADALGTHLDSFQRITADPASMSVIRYTAVRPFVIHVNHTGAALTAGAARQHRPRRPSRRRRADRRRRGRRLDRLTLPHDYG